MSSFTQLIPRPSVTSLCGSPFCSQLRSSTSILAPITPPVQVLPAIPLQYSVGSGTVRHHCHTPRAAAVLDPPATGIASTRVSAIPSSAETARTIVDIVHHGTLCTVDDAGLPLGTYISYVLDDGGEPILRLRADAVHTRNLGRNPKCSLFVQPQDLPARLLARTTLIGQVIPAELTVAAAAEQSHARLHIGGAGIDSPQPTDLFYRLQLHQCFFVGGLGSNSAAELLSAEDYKAAQPDPLRADAPTLIANFNRDRADDVLRIGAFAAGSPIENTYASQLMWIDHLGIYLSVVTQEEAMPQVHRVNFQRQVLDERDARSVLTLLAQVAWERERNYIPPIPGLQGV